MPPYDPYIFGPSPTPPSLPPMQLNYYSYEMGGTTYFYPVLQREPNEPTPQEEEGGYYDESQLFIPASTSQHAQSYAVPLMDVSYAAKSNAFSLAPIPRPLVYGMKEE